MLKVGYPIPPTETAVNCRSVFLWILLTGQVWVRKDFRAKMEKQ